jgi:hypothetical protein
MIFRESLLSILALCSPLRTASQKGESEERNAQAAERVGKTIEG